MTTDLERFRDHCRDMVHRTKPVVGSRPAYVGETPDRWGQVEVVLASVPTDAEREVWRRLADEIDAYLSPASEDQVLFPTLEETR